MTRLPTTKLTLALATLMLSAAIIPAAHAQDAAALCKLSKAGGNNVVRLPLTPEIASQLQGAGQPVAPGGLAEVHGDGHVMYNGQDVTQQTAALCANGGDQPKGEPGSKGNMEPETGAAATSMPSVPGKGRIVKHHANKSAAAGDHYTPTTGAGATPLTSDTAQAPTGSSPTSSTSPLSPSSPLNAPTTPSGAPTPSSSGAFTPPESAASPSSALTAPSPGANPASPSLSSPASIAPPAGSSGSAPSDLASPPEPMHAGGGSSSAPQGPMSSSSSGSSSGSGH